MFHDRSIVHTDTVLGESQAITPEGFLLCKNVPIARIGMQEYLNDEICDEHDHDNPLHAARGKNGIVQVMREPEDVFRPETIASFEGKDVVDDHPEDVVNPDNYHEHTVGVTLNPRRGEGAMSDFIIADLLIKKASAIAAVRAGKREVSCGYDADYEPLGPGRARQHNIIGNHVALVDRGRCGFRCAIGDKDPDMTEKVTVKKGSLVHRVLTALKSKDRKALNAAMEEMEEEDEAPDAPALEATGTHVHLHLPGTEQASGKGEPPAADSDEEEEEEEEEGEPENKGLDKRVMMLEASMHEMAETMRKFMSKHSGGKDEDPEEEEEEAEGDEEPGNEEAEGEVPESEDEAEVEEEPKEKDKAKKDKAKKDMKKDKATVRDSAHLKDTFKEVVSDAEVLAPGLKMPTFDAKAASKLTRDSLCLLKRRALASAQRDEKNGGADAVKTMLGKKPLAGMDCASVDTVFNGAVALMKDRNAQDDAPRNINEARGKKKTGDTKAPQTPAELNSMMRAHYKQAPKA